MSEIRIPTSLAEVAVAVRGEGPPLVLLHANPGETADFAGILDELAEEHTIYGVDWPGYGASAHPLSPTSVTAMDYGRILPEILDGLHLARTALLGNSVGGYAATRLALDDPDRVSALILVNSGGFTRPTPVSGTVIRLLGTTPVMNLLAGRLPRRYLRHRTPYTDQMIARDVARRDDRPTLALQASIWRSFGDPVYSLRASAAALTVPTLLAWGVQDPIVGKDGADAREIIPGSVWHPLPTGHAPFAEDPAGFLSVGLPFLAAHLHQPHTS